MNEKFSGADFAYGMLPCKGISPSSMSEKYIGSCLQSDNICRLMCTIAKRPELQDICCQVEKGANDEAAFQGKRRTSMHCDILDALFPMLSMLFGNGSLQQSCTSLWCACSAAIAKIIF